MAISVTDRTQQMPRDLVAKDPVVEVRRKRARRTALLFGGIALALYFGFILSGILGR